MEAMRESWTDDRLDDLNGKVDALRVEMRTEFKAVRGEMKEEFAAVRGEMREEFASVRAEMKAGFEKLDLRFEKFEIRSDERFEVMMDRLYSMQRMMFQFCGGGLVALIGFIATQV
jgi:formylmethanofuran dehydrogenase subunit E